MNIPAKPSADADTLEQIRKLKYRYLRYMDWKRWEDFGDTLAEDATADYGTPAYGEALSFAGRDKIVAFMRENLNAGIITVHSCGQPEIEVDGDTATGVWCLEDTVVVTDYRLVIQGAAYYEDRYRLRDGVWRIEHTGYTRLYESMVSMDDMPSFKLTANHWAQP